MKNRDTNDLERVTRILERHVSRIHAQSILRQALSEQQLSPSQFKATDVAKIFSSLQRSLRLFTSEGACVKALREITEGVDSSPRVDVAPQSFEIAVEADISRARGAARQICEAVGAKPFVLQKVTTVVSELARNIVSYSSGGKVELAVKSGPKQRIVIRAVDRGPGISNLSHIMSGAYQSKTGLGRGLVGCKRLADAFDITTGRMGTDVMVEVEL